MPPLTALLDDRSAAATGPAGPVAPSALAGPTALGAPSAPVADAADLYGRCLLAAGVDGPGAGWRLRASGGRAVELPVERWCGDLSPADVELLDRCREPVLDVGCGPGRLTAGLARRGIRCLGVDRSAVAVALAARRGAPVVRRCLFDPLPGEGRWATVLLADGNIGIGGDVERLLRRLRQVASPTGRIIAEVDPPASGSGALRLRFESSGGATGAWFPWAHLAVDDAAAGGRRRRPAGGRGMGGATVAGSWSWPDEPDRAPTPSTGAATG